MAEQQSDGEDTGKRAFSWFMYANNAPYASSASNFAAYVRYYLQGKRPSPRYRVWLAAQKQGSDSWKDEKGDYASASNMAGYAGLNPFKSQYALLKASIWEPPDNLKTANPHMEAFNNFMQFIMDRGSLLEDGPRQIYDTLRKKGLLFDTVEEANAMKTIEEGMALHDEFPHLSASPDLLIGLLGSGEIKCPYSKKALRFAKVHMFTPVYYMTQEHTVMAVFKREWCDFISYGRLNAVEEEPTPFSSAIVFIRVYFNQDYWNALVARVNAFVDTAVRLRQAGIHELPNNTMLVMKEARNTIAGGNFSAADIDRAMEAAASKVWPERDRRAMGPLMRVLCDSGIIDQKFKEASYNPPFKPPLNDDGTVNMNDPRITDPGGVEYMQPAPFLLGEHIKLRTRTIIVPNIDHKLISETDPSQGHYGDFTIPLLLKPDLSKLQFYNIARKAAK